jgi:hypothetical protein
MCLFSYPRGLGERGIDVSDTTIFARKAGPDSQVLAYQMALRADRELAMILPVPVGSRDEARAMEFISLEGCSDFFELLGRQLPIWPQEELGVMTLSVDSRSSSPRPVLKVHAVGAYEASFVPSAADFDRLDERFRLPPEVWASLREYADWGFAVFKLKDFTREARPAHAMAFRFVTRSPDRLFFPTVHVHDGRVHTLAAFDHQLYFQSALDCGKENLAFAGGRPVGDAQRRLILSLYRDKVDDTAAVDGKGVLIWAERSGEVVPHRHDVERAGGVLEAGTRLHAFGMRNTLPNQDTWIDLKAGRVGSDPWERSVKSAG